MFLVFMSLFPPLSLILCDIMSSPHDAVSLCLNYLFEQTQNIAASIHPVGYFSEQLPCTDTYMLACLLALLVWYVQCQLLISQFAGQ